MSNLVRPGTFVAIDGPKRTGKSTATRLLAQGLGALLDQECICLAQPSDTPLGRLLRQGEEGMVGRAYALALAADRLFQYEQIIRPALARGVSVVSDRYTPSSLVLQRIDGLSIEEVWRYNRHTPAPDMLFYLHHSSDELAKRVAECNRSRIQALGSPTRELDYYEDARAFLARKGWHQRKINADTAPDEVVDTMLRLIQNNT